MDKHIASVEKLQKSSRETTKVARNQLRDIAQLLVFKHLHSDPVEPFACVYREDGDYEFMNILANELTERDILVLALVGGERGRGSGQFLLAGEEGAVAALGPK